MSPSPTQQIIETERTTYKLFASSWNTHTDALVERGGTIHWEALAALLAGALAAAIVLKLYFCFATPCIKCLCRTSVGLQCPVVIYVAPDEDRLPQLWARGQQPSRFAPAHQRSAGTKATASQWNAMRAALGPKVPDKNVADLLRKHGDDTKAAVADFYGNTSMY